MKTGWGGGLKAEAGRVTAQLLPSPQAGEVEGTETNG